MPDHGDDTVTQARLADALAALAKQLRHELHEAVAAERWERDAASSKESLPPAPSTPSRMPMAGGGDVGNAAEWLNRELDRKVREEGSARPCLGAGARPDGGRAAAGTGERGPGAQGDEAAEERAARDAVVRREPLAPLDPTRRIPAALPPGADDQLFERVAALEAKVLVLSEEIHPPTPALSTELRHGRVDIPPAALHDGHSEPGHHDHLHDTIKSRTEDGPEERKDGACNGADALIPLGVLTAHRLDAGDMYELVESVWDGCLFLGITPLGKPTSVVMIAMYVLNVWVQLAFVMIVWAFMVEPQVGTDTLDELLRFRVGMAHSVEYADTVLQRSMASQICNEEDRLHMSGAQRTLYSDTLDFSSGGPLLSLLAQLCWLGSMLKEINAAYSFMRSVLQVPRGERTEVITADSTSDGLHEVDRHTGQKVNSVLKTTHSGLGLPTGSLVALTVVTRLTVLCRARLVWAIFGIAVPRALLAMFVGLAGVQYLATSSQMSELVLNAIALAFIIELDELLYSLFAPRRLHTLMNNIEPFPMPPLRRGIPGLNCFLKMLFVATGVCLVKLLLLDPVFWRLEQAQDILCSGETDFVYAVNPATGMLHVTKTQQPEAWAQVEKTLLQVARPELESKYGWDIDPELLELAASDFSMAVVTQTGMGASYGGVILEKSEYEPAWFEAVSIMPSMGVSDMARFLPCADREAGNTFDQADRFLEQFTGIPGFTCSSIATNISEIDQGFLEPSIMCSLSAMVNIRALCPVSCGCHLGQGGMTGMFGTLAFGCPQACHEYHTIIDQWMYFNDIDGDTDGDGVVNDGAPLGVCRDALDDELIGDPNASLACLGDFNQCLELTGRFTRWYATYVRGILPYMGQAWAAAIRLTKVAFGMNVVGLLPVDSVEAFTARFWAGGVSVSLLDGKWMLTDPQVPHPRNLTGCRFLASYELSALLGFDLCKPSGELTSIRGVCPVSCGCAKGMDECSAACTDVFSDDAKDHDASDTIDAATTAADIDATNT